MELLSGVIEVRRESQDVLEGTSERDREPLQ
jgi:hypothetical protein